MVLVVGGCRRFRASTAKFVSVKSWEFIIFNSSASHSSGQCARERHKSFVSL